MQPKGSGNALTAQLSSQKAKASSGVASVAQPSSQTAMSGLGIISAAQPNSQKAEAKPAQVSECGNMVLYIAELWQLIGFCCA